MSENTKKKKNIINRLKFIIVLSLVILTIGVLGFYLFNDANWVNSFYDASAIMSAVGAADEPHTVSGKIFASFYTLSCGLIYIFLVALTVSALIGED